MPSQALAGRSVCRGSAGPAPREPAAAVPAGRSDDEDGGARRPPFRQHPYQRLALRGVDRHWADSHAGLDQSVVAVQLIGAVDADDGRSCPASVGATPRSERRGHCTPCRAASPDRVREMAGPLTCNWGAACATLPVPTARRRRYVRENDPRLGRRGRGVTCPGVSGSHPSPDECMHAIGQAVGHPGTPGGAVEQRLIRRVRQEADLDQRRWHVWRLQYDESGAAVRIGQ